MKFFGNLPLYLLKKILIFLVSVFLLSLVVFYIARLAPGDPLVSYYGDRVEKMSAEERAQIMERLGPYPYSVRPLALQRSPWGVWHLL